MSEKIKETQQRLKDLGYFASESLAKTVFLFEAAGKRSERSIPTLLLEGKSGAGKTFLAETFAKMVDADEKFVQCFPRMGTENFQYDVNVEGVIKQDVDNAIKPGILLQAINQSHQGPVVLIIDELDKARAEVDSFLLDFLENGRLTTGTDTYVRGEHPIYTFITSNDKRELDEALINRSRKVEVPRPEKDLFLEILGLPQNHYLGYIYDKCPNFSIRQAKNYLEDLELLGVDIDEQSLRQYINLNELNVSSLADVQRLAELEDESLEADFPALQRCSITIYENESEQWIKFFEDEKNEDFRIYADSNDDGRFYVDIDTVEQLQRVCEHVEIDRYRNVYNGWFEYTGSKEKFEGKKIIWASNITKKDGTRFGLMIQDNVMYRIAENNERTFVFLESGSDCSLEHFFGYEQDSNSPRYQTDSDYDDSDYDDNSDYDRY